MRWRVEISRNNGVDWEDWNGDSYKSVHAAETMGDAVVAYFRGVEFPPQIRVVPAGDHPADRSLTLDTYQERAAQTAVFPRQGGCPIYPVLGLVDEACEVAGKLEQALFRQVNFPENALLLSVLDFATKCGVMVGRIKKLHRDAGGVPDTAFRNFMTNWVHDMDTLLDAVSHYSQEATSVPFPPVDFGDAKESFVKELGDAQWYIAATATEIGVPLSYVATTNLEKLASRAARGVVQGSGDER